MKRTAIILLACAVSSLAHAQFSLRGIGVNFEANGTSGMRHEGLGNLVSGQSGFEADLGNGIVMSRTSTSYALSFDGAESRFFALDLSLMQGATNLYNSAYDWRDNQDSFFSNSINFDMYGATVGLRSMAKFRTDPTRRFHYHFGLGAEAMFAYGITSYGRSSKEVNHWPSQYFHSESSELDLNLLKNFQSHQVIQQVGVAFRLGKDEEFYPLDRTYIELNFNILSNFSLINQEWSSYRTYGGALRLIYEIN